MKSIFAPYPEYQTTHLGWLDRIPAHWELKRLKYLGEAIIGLTYSPDDVVSENEGTLVLRSSNIQNKRLSFEDNVFVAKIVPEKLKTQRGDILICARNGSRALIGKNAQIDECAEGMTFGAFMSIFRSPYNDYLSKVFNSALFEFQSGSFLTATINQLTTGNLNSFEIPLPSEDERKLIASFLDHETAKIDTLIEKQQQLIKLLKEKRQAVISHAVTKGLNPDAPMKDSGVEWLGEVPENWTFSQLGYCAFVTKLTGFEYTNVWQTEEDGEVIALRGFNIKERKLDLKNVEKISSKLSKKLDRSKLSKGDIVFPCTGTIGNAAMIEMDDLFHINQNIAKIRFDSSVHPRFAIYWLTSSYVRTTIDRNNSSGMQPVVLIGDIRKLPFPRMGFQEQEHIANFLDSTIARMDYLISKALVGIELMEERRTALISAAVTGKIDVRNWQPTDKKNTEEVEVTA